MNWRDATHFDSVDDYHTTTQVVETSVTVNINSPIQDYVHPDDHTQPTYEMTPVGFKPFKPVSSFLSCFLNFIRVLRVVITPSVTEGVITTRSNRMKSRLLKLNIFWVSPGFTAAFIATAPFSHMGRHLLKMLLKALDKMMLLMFP